MSKTIRKEIRMSEREAQELARLATENNLTESEYIRQRMLQRPENYAELSQQVCELINEINHIGVNINQIVKNANSGFYRATDKEKLMAYMKKINEEVRELIGKIDST